MNGPSAAGDRQVQSHPEKPHVLVVGESLVDIVRRPDGETQEYAGGSAANVAVALARLGRPVRFATAFADDAHGAMVADYLRAAGVELANNPRAVGRTATAAATIGTDGAATYEFDLAWQLNPVPLDPPPVVVHTCSLGAVLEPGATEVVGLLERLRTSATVTYDINARPAITGTGPDLVAQVDRVASLADLVRASDEDLPALWPELDIAASVQRLLGLGPQRGRGDPRTRRRDLDVDLGRGHGGLGARTCGRHHRGGRHIRRGTHRRALGARPPRRTTGSAVRHDRDRGARARRWCSLGRGVPPRG